MSSLPAFLGQGLVQFGRMIAVVPFASTRFRVRIIVLPSLGHEVSLVQLVEHDESLLLLMDIVVDPQLVVRNVLIHVLMSAFGEFDVIHAADETALDEPDLQPVRKNFPQPVMDGGGLRQFLSALYFSQIPGPDALFTLVRVRTLASGLRVDAFLAGSVLNEHMTDVELLLVGIRLGVDPQLAPGDLVECVVVAEVAELLVQIFPDVCAIDEQYGKPVARTELFQSWLSEDESLSQFASGISDRVRRSGRRRES